MVFHMVSLSSTVSLGHTFKNQTPTFDSLDTSAKATDSCLLESIFQRKMDLCIVEVMFSAVGCCLKRVFFFSGIKGLFEPRCVKRGYLAGAESLGKGSWQITVHAGCKRT